MPLPETHVQEKLSLAYVQAVVARAGAHYNSEDAPEYGIDCTIKPVRNLPNGRFTYSGYFLQCQVKATTNWEERDNLLIYDLKADAYNKLAGMENQTAILVVFKLPQNRDEWLLCTEEQLLLKNCCYWAIVSGDQTLNDTSVRIRIPKNQVFTPDAVQELLDRLELNRGSLT